MKIKIFTLALLCGLCTLTAKAQYYGVRVNALAALTGTLNAGFEASLSDRYSLDVTSYWNSIHTSRLRMQFLAGQVGVRRWLFESYTGHFMAAHAAVARYHVGTDKKHYKGWLTGAGFSYGYSWPLSPRWNVCAEAGIGLYYMNDTQRRYGVSCTQNEYIHRNHRWVVAPSKLEVSFSYLF